MPITPGFAELVGSARSAKIPVLLLGAVPTFVTQAIVDGVGESVDRIAGSTVVTAGGRLQDTDEVCTPSRKAQAATQWLHERCADPQNVWVIGNSIGDLPTMALVPQEKRIGFNAEADTGLPPRRALPGGPRCGTGLWTGLAAVADVDA